MNTGTDGKTTKTFVGVLLTMHRKHLLVDLKTRRTACGKVMKTGVVSEDFVYWNVYAPSRCPLCLQEWEKRKGT